MLLLLLLLLLQTVTTLDDAGARPSATACA